MGPGGWRKSGPGGMDLKLVASLRGTNGMETACATLSVGNKVKSTGRMEIAFNCLTLDPERIF